ncbi:phosphoglycerate mutase [Thalassotalea euphylliae]|uniref:Phosphoglycerate mutase n=1 Tax=Thalassotalea euphylliae TaxID=1655234 RepID=A0A3E0TR80_9GAMM|nr:histidine phosphatase family protein [Thalassotalea euphylliae]REL27014.1 phosphoglycerate mutase [Thalassotalea euphylliae]
MKETRKTLQLIRHAKSSWQQLGLSDIERPLNQRGKKSCQIMAQHIHALGSDLTNVYVSPALRAQETIKRIFAHLQQLQEEQKAQHQALSTEQAQWHTVEQLYTFDSAVLRSFLQNQSPHCRAITLVGHNPALTDLCNHLTNAYIDNIPTCGYVQLVANDEFAWSDIHDKSFTLQHFCTPKTRQQSEIR